MKNKDLKSELRKGIKDKKFSKVNDSVTEI